MLTLYRCGRQAEALEVYRAARLALSDELGLDPSPELQELERKVLRQDPSLPRRAAWTMRPSRAAERRLVTVLAATPPAADDPEQHRRRLDEMLASVRDVLARHGGALERFGPEGLVAVFGAEAPATTTRARCARGPRSSACPRGSQPARSSGEPEPWSPAPSSSPARSGIRLDERTRALVRAERRLDAPLVGRTRSAEAPRRARRRRETGPLPGRHRRRRARDRQDAPRSASSRSRGLARPRVLVARCSSYGKGPTFLPLLGALRRRRARAALAGEDPTPTSCSPARRPRRRRRRRTLGESYWAVRRLLEALATSPYCWSSTTSTGPSRRSSTSSTTWASARGTPCSSLPRPAGARTDARRQLAVRPAGRRGGARDRRHRTWTTRHASGSSSSPRETRSTSSSSPRSRPRAAKGCHRRSRPCSPAASAGSRDTNGPCSSELRWSEGSSPAAPSPRSPGEVARELLVAFARRLHPPRRGGRPGRRRLHLPPRPPPRRRLREPDEADRADLHERVAAWLDRDGPGDDALVGYHLEQAAHYRRELGEDAGGARRGGRRTARRCSDARLAPERHAAAIGLLGAGRAPPCRRATCGTALGARRRPAPGGASPRSRG